VLTIRFDSPESDTSLQLLHNWLQADREFMRQAHLRIVSNHLPDSMGGAWDVIQIIFDDGVALASLAVSFLAWYDSRPKRDREKIVMVVRRGGTEIEIRGNDLETTEDLASRLYAIGESNDVAATHSVPRSPGRRQ